VKPGLLNVGNHLQFPDLTQVGLMHASADIIDYHRQEALVLMD
jgi:hypothetical protein